MAAHYIEAMITGINEFGGKGDGCTDNSEAFAAAIASLRRAGGGTLEVPQGTYLTGPIELFSDIALKIERGAVLRFLPDIGLYVPVLTRWEGITCFGMHPLIFARDAHGIALKGEGLIDGNGQPWWEALRRKKSAGQRSPIEPIEKILADYNSFLSDQPSGGGGREMQFLRPPLVQFFRCSNVIIEGLKFANSPFWTIHPVFSEHIRIEHVTVENPPDAPNTDGIDIDSCVDVTVTDSLVDVGDDCIAIKAGSGARGLREGKESRGITIRGCHFKQGHGGVVVGSETAGGIHDVTVSQCTFEGTDRGVRIKTRRGRGGTVSNLHFSDLAMEGVLCPVAINMYYRCGAKPEEKPSLFSLNPQPISTLTPHLRDIEICNLQARACRSSAGFIAGLPESPIEGLSMQHCSIELAPEALASVSECEMFEGIPDTEHRSIRVRHAHCQFRDVQVQGLQRGENPFLLEEGAQVMQE